MNLREWNISVCGLNCTKCDLLGKRDCGGCRGSIENHWSPECQFLACIKDKEYDFCFECRDFPCSKIISFANDGHEHHRITVENMKSMKKMDLKDWIESQDEVSFCPGWKI